MTNRTKSEFTSHCRIASKTNLLLLLFPAWFAHARYSSRMTDRLLISSPPPPHLIGGFDTYVQITDVFCEGHIVFVDVCFVAKGENFFRLERMPSIQSLHQQHIQCVHVFNVQSQKKKKITWPRVTLVLARNVSLGKLLRLSFGITQFKSNAPS